MVNFKNVSGCILSVLAGWGETTPFYAPFNGGEIYISNEGLTYYVETGYFYTEEEMDLAGALALKAKLEGFVESELITFLETLSFEKL
jgi:hypothetical protein